MNITSIFTGPQALIPMNALSLQKSYVFELTVFKDKREAKVTQTVQIVDYDPLNIQIKCIKNCNERRSNIDHFIHLQAICPTCLNINENIQFEWKYKDKIVGKGERLIYELKKHPLETRFNFEVKGTLDEQVGMNVFETTVSKVNVDQCEISPGEGFALTTLFKISCDVKGEESDSIKLSIYQNNVFLLDAHQNSVNLFLIDLGFKVANIKIVIKNLYGVRVEQNLIVKLKEIAMKPSLQHLSKFIDKSEEARNIYHSVSIGDFTQAIGIFNTVVTKIKTVENVEEQLLLMEKLLFSVKSVPEKSFLNPTLLNSALLYISSSLPNPHQISSKVSQLILQTSFSLIDKSEDVILENADMLTDIINHIIEPFDELTAPHDDYIDQPKDSFTENYPDYDDLGVEIIQKYMDLKTLVMKVEQTVESLTEALVSVMEPLEPAKIIKTQNSTHFFRILNSVTETTLNDELKIFNSTIELDQNLLTDLTQNEWNKVGLSITLYKSNPYWWYHDQGMNISNVFMVNMVEQSMNYPNERRFIHKLKYPLKLSRNISSDLNSQFSDHVKHMYDMPSFKILSPMNETIDIHFQLSPKHATLKAGFTSNKRPMYKEIISQDIDIEHGTRILYKTVNSNANEKSHFIHMGLISVDNETVYVNFTCTALSCVHWDKKTSHWTTKHSEVISNENETFKCDFMHLSTLAGTQHKPLVKQDPIRTFPHVLVENQVIVYLITFLIFIFVACFTWAYHQDKKDLERRTAILVEDNSPLHKYEYLVIIQTGSDPEAGRESSNLITNLHNTLKIFIRNIISCWDSIER